MGCSCYCFVCKKNNLNQIQTLNLRFTLAAAAAAAPRAPNINSSQITFNRRGSVISYESAVRNSALVVQPINQVDIDLFKLPTYEEFISKQILTIFE